MITLDGLEVPRNSIVEVRNENGLYYAYTSDFIKINITEEDYNEIINNIKH